VHDECHLLVRLQMLKLVVPCLLLQVLFLPSATLATAGIINPITHLAFVSFPSSSSCCCCSSSSSRSVVRPKSFSRLLVGSTGGFCCCYLSIPTLYDLLLPNESLCEEDKSSSAIVQKSPLAMNDDEQNSVLHQYLVSPAPESHHVIGKCVHNFNLLSSHGCFHQDTAISSSPAIASDDDNLSSSSSLSSLQRFYWDMEALAQYLVKPGYMLELFQTTQKEERTDDGLSSWYGSLSWRWKIAKQNGKEKVVMRHGLLDLQMITNDDASHPPRRQLYQLSSTLEITKTAATMFECDHIHSDSALSIKKNEMQLKMEETIQQMEQRLCLTLGSDLRGVTSADAAFLLAISGILQSHHLFDALVKIGIHELKRSGRRSSFQPKYILQMVEKFAASGYDSKYMVELYHLAGTCLGDKGYGDVDVISQLLQGSFGLHSSRPLLWIWRYSSRQRKVSIPPIVMRNGNDQTSENDVVNLNIIWENYFEDTSKGLVVDLGSGFGVCLLNLLSLSSRQHDYDLKTDDLPHMDWSKYNFAGADLNPQLIGYANGVTSRFPLAIERDRLHFFCCSAIEILSNLKTYKGKIELLMIHFPSPYRSSYSSDHDDNDNDNDNSNNKNNERSGNSQLPGNAKGDFMITPQVATMISNILQKDNQIQLLFQTKCEDVAIHVKNLFLSTGTLEIGPCSHAVKSVEETYAVSGRRPKRLDHWLETTPEAERAEGMCWSSVSMMPTMARPETEIQCEYDNTVVHRCLFRSVKKYNTVNRQRSSVVKTY